MTPEVRVRIQYMSDKGGDRRVGGQLHSCIRLKISDGCTRYDEPLCTQDLTHIVDTLALLYHI